MSDTPNVRQAVPFFNVKDMDAAVRFYVDGLGGKITIRWEPEGKLRWCWIELGDAALMLQTFMMDGPHKNVPNTPVGLGTSVCFMCRDAIALYQEFRSRGLEPKRPFVGNKLWVTEIRDPDGYSLAFESPTDEPEERVYEG